MGGTARGSATPGTRAGTSGPPSQASPTGTRGSLRSEPGPRGQPGGAGGRTHEAGPPGSAPTQKYARTPGKRHVLSFDCFQWVTGHLGLNFNSPSNSSDLQLPRRRNFLLREFSDLGIVERIQWLKGNASQGRRRRGRAGGQGHPDACAGAEARRSPSSASCGGAGSLGVRCPGGGLRELERHPPPGTRASK